MKKDTKLSRREILGGAAATTAAALAVTSQKAVAQSAEGQPLTGSPALPKSPEKRLGWAIVGLGTFAIGQVIPGFQTAKKSKITAFVSGNADKAQKLGDSYGVTQFYNYDNFDTIINDDRIDCVYIVLPVGLHAEYTIRALKAGKHVLCEKPMASTSEECEAMIAAAKQNDRQLGVGYRVHFEPTNVEALRRFKSGDIGALRYSSGDAGFSANPDFPPHKWRLTKKLGGGGSMYDIGIYGLNGCLMYFDAPPVEVSAVYSTPEGDPRFTEVEGGLDWRMRFADGVTAQGSSSYTYSYIAAQRIHGTKGTITMEPASAYYENNLLLKRDNRPREILNPGNPIVQFAAQVDGFSDAAAANKPHRTPGEMGLRDIRIIEAMYRSADQGGVSIKL